LPAAAEPARAKPIQTIRDSLIANSNYFNRCHRKKQSDSCGLTKKAEPPGTKTMKPLKSLRTTDSANPGWLRRLVRRMVNLHNRAAFRVGRAIAWNTGKHHDKEPDASTPQDPLTLSELLLGLGSEPPTCEPRQAVPSTWKSRLADCISATARSWRTRLGRVLVLAYKKSNGANPPNEKS
jgi:hypothetical protein